MEQTAVGRQRKAGGRGRGRPPRTLWGTSRAQDWTLSMEGLFQDKWTAQRSLAAAQAEVTGGWEASSYTTAVSGKRQGQGHGFRNRAARSESRLSRFICLSRASY